MRARTLPHSRLRSGGGTRIARRTRKTVVIATVAALGAGLLAGCADDGKDEEGSSSNEGGGKTKITLGLFGSFGFEEAGLYDEYEKLNPNIDIQQTVIERNENYYPPLVNHLTTNSGLQDIQGIEVGNIAEVVQKYSDKFVDLSKYGKESDYLPWKWEQGTAENGQTIGLGTDVGPMAICYRKDLFEAAGLPTDREEVGKLWTGDWAKLVDIGKDYKAKGPKGTTFMDSPGGLFNAIIGSEKERYYDASGKVIYKTNPAVKKAFDLTAEAAEAGLIGNQTQFQPAWDTTIANSKFAAMACPPWMLGYIEGKSKPENAGKWDVAAPPKAANWGGSFLSVPKSGKNTEEAAKLAAWLTAPEQQAKLFSKRGSFPTAQAAYDLPLVKDAKNKMTGDAPIGQIYAPLAKELPVQVVGPKDQIIQQGLTDNGVILVTQGKSPKEAWENAVKTIDNNLEQ
ncbi:ABC transporter substrate-binding protein [Streptomyces ipomoeae]|uniref:ABC transporter substrate-binding protein n=1 Tax=Streptomyces ipomoeae TaxID=103232 RepID=UPI0011461B20|nr:extracellular solute-binding protein [Streptomyces ipomoeae]MDX2937476.1 extracellular solute-binding protein [Streptomyces ipomoeae]TQE26635.1 extracellular solute-binding protein [Streptomyces ipomoeae]